MDSSCVVLSIIAAMSLSQETIQQYTALLNRDYSIVLEKIL
ncbi:hypothetical protein RIEGSTA812A_PEG_271 [invertebrate metagenome]|uniref:Uncharacterized protein n=1 Tax=invertebrate metagenome TaxID=1711999 RepID=A0A484H9F0_9ZZZZ